MNMGEGGTVAALTSQTLEKLSRVPLVVIDFWAPWCGPCRRLAPAYEEVAGEVTAKYGGRVQFCKVNVDDEPAMAQKYGIMTIPAVIGFSGGKPLDRFAGRSKDELSQWVLKLAGSLKL